MDKKKINQSLNLHRLAVAARDIECARGGFENMKTLSIEIGDNLYQPLLFGAIASYCRPFTSNEGFGALSGKWKKFEGGAELLDTHNKIFEYRNKVVAHSDIVNNKLTIIPPGSVMHIDDNEHVITEAGYAVSTPLLGQEVITMAIELCKYQHSRMMEFLATEIGSRFNGQVSNGKPFEFDYLKH